MTIRVFNVASRKPLPRPPYVMTLAERDENGDWVIRLNPKIIEVCELHELSINTFNGRRSSLSRRYEPPRVMPFSLALILPFKYHFRLKEERPVRKPQGHKYRKGPVDYIALAQSNGISKYTFYKRCDDGLDPYNAATNKKYQLKWSKGRTRRKMGESRKRVKPVYLREDGVSWAKVAEENGIPERRFHARITDLDWTPERAATETRKRPPRYLHKREDGRPWVEVATENGIPEKRFYARIEELDWSPERAATEKIHNRGPKPGGET